MLSIENQKKVAEALRSGDYTKDEEGGQLKRKVDGKFCYCVMGVVADVLDPGGWKPGDNKHSNYRHRGNPGTLSPGVLQKMDITAFKMWDMIHLSDGGYKTFAQFADDIDAGTSPLCAS